MFKGKRAICWDEVKEYLKQYVVNSYMIEDTNDLVFIGNDLPDEYTGSKYTNSLKGANAKAKANAVQGIPEMLEIAEGKHFRENSGNKHLLPHRLMWKLLHAQCRYNYNPHHLFGY